MRCRGRDRSTLNQNTVNFSIRWLFRKQVEQSGSDDNQTPGRRCCSAWRFLVRHRRFRRPNSLEHCRTLRSQKQQVDGCGSHVYSKKASRLRCVQQLYLCCRWSRRLHGTLKCRAIQVRAEKNSNSNPWSYLNYFQSRHKFMVSNRRDDLP